ncbi:MAG: GNAT family N-acetyltransferase [Halioglobus sp.]
MTDILPVVTDDQVQRVVAMAYIVWPQHYDPIIGNEQVVYMLEKFQSERAIRSQIDEGVSYFILASEGQDCGYLSYELRDDELFLSKVYVLADYQGRGLGKLALDFVRERAQHRRIRLTVNKHNSDSIAFYERTGFIRAGEVLNDIGGGFYMDDFIFDLHPQRES